MKQKHVSDFTTLQMLFSDVKCVLAVESGVCRRMWLFHACTEILIHFSGPAGSPFPGDSHLPVLLLHAPPVPALAQASEAGGRGAGDAVSWHGRPLPALCLRVTTLLRWCRPCSVQSRTPRLCLQHLLLPPFSLLFCFSRIPICPRSPLSLQSTWASATC